MTQFTKSFIWRYIVYSLILGLVLLIFQSIIIGILSQVMSIESNKLFFVILAITTAVLGAYITYFIAYKVIGAVSKKGCYDYPKDPEKWFKNFTVIMIALDIVSSVFSYIRWKKQLKESYAKLDLYVDLYGEMISEKVEQTRDAMSSLNITLIICMILQNIVGIAMLLMLVPKLKKKYNEG